MVEFLSREGQQNLPGWIRSGVVKTLKSYSADDANVVSALNRFARAIRLHEKKYRRGEECTPAPALRSRSEQHAGPSPASTGNYSADGE